MDIAGTRHPNVVRSQSFGNPEALAAREVDQDPPLIGVGEQVGVASVGGKTVPVNQLAHDLHGRARASGPFHHDPGQVAVVRSALRIGRHLPQLDPGARRHVPGRYTMFVQSAIRQGRREARKVGVVHGQVAKRGGHLRNLHELSWITGFRSRSHRQSGTGSMLPARHDLQPMARRLVAVAGQKHTAVPGQVLPHVDGIAGLGARAVGKADDQAGQHDTYFHGTVLILLAFGVEQTPVLQPGPQGCTRVLQLSNDLPDSRFRSGGRPGCPIPPPSPVSSLWREIHIYQQQTQGGRCHENNRKQKEQRAQ